MPHSDSFEDFVSRVRTALDGPLPGTLAHMRMAPRSRLKPDLLRVEGKTCREAAVLLLLYPLQEIPTVVLTVRRKDLQHHAGQVSMPGGAREPGETLRQTALREAEEEIGITSHDVDILGTLTPLYIPPSRFCVYPFMGIVSAMPAFSPDPTEVATLVHIPVPDLLRSENQHREHRTVRGEQLEVPFFKIESCEIWGATAMILAEFATILDAAALH